MTGSIEVKHPTWKGRFLVSKATAQTNEAALQAVQRWLTSLEFQAWPKEGWYVAEDSALS